MSTTETQAQWHPTLPDPARSDRVRVRLADGWSVVIRLEIQQGRVVGSIMLPPGARLDIERAGDAAAVVWLDPSRRASGNRSRLLRRANG